MLDAQFPWLRGAEKHPGSRLLSLAHQTVGSAGRLGGFVRRAGKLACGHGDAELRAEQAKARHYRDAYETQGQEIQQLRKRVADLEREGCR